MYYVLWFLLLFTLMAAVSLGFYVLALVVLHGLTDPVVETDQEGKEIRNAGRNWFFCRAKEGQIKVILRFGQFHRAVMSYKDHWFDQDWDVRHVSTNGKKGVDWWDEEKMEYTKKIVALQRRPWSWGGIFWVGIPPIYSVHTYTFRFVSFRQAEDPQTGKLTEKIVARAPEIDYILAQDDTYFTEIKGAETAGLVPLHVDLLITARCVNPYKALFRAQEWLEQVINIMKPIVRSYLSTLDYEKVISEKKEGLERDFDVLLMRPPRQEGETEEGWKKRPRLEGLAEYIERSYGIRIKKLGIVSFQPPEELKGFEEVASRPWAGGREGGKVVALAEAKSKEIGILARAELGRINTVYPQILEKGPEGLGIRTLESIDKAAEKPGNWVIPLSPIRGMVSDLIGEVKKPAPAEDPTKETSEPKTDTKEEKK